MQFLVRYQLENLFLQFLGPFYVWGLNLGISSFLKTIYLFLGCCITWHAWGCICPDYFTRCPRFAFLFSQFLWLGFSFSPFFDNFLSFDSPSIFCALSPTWLQVSLFILYFWRICFSFQLILFLLVGSSRAWLTEEPVPCSALAANFRNTNQLPAWSSTPFFNIYSFGTDAKKGYFWNFPQIFSTKSVEAFIFIISFANCNGIHFLSEIYGRKAS